MNINDLVTTNYLFFVKCMIESIEYSLINLAEKFGNLIRIIGLKLDHLYKYSVRFCWQKADL